MTGSRYGGARYGGFRWSDRGRRIRIAGVPLRIDSIDLSPSTVAVEGEATRSRADQLRTALDDRVGGYRVVEQAGGQFRVESTDGDTLPTLALPATVTPPEPESQPVAVESLNIEEIAPEWRSVTLSMQRTSAPTPGDVTPVDSGTAWTLAIGSHTTLSLPADAVRPVGRRGTSAGSQVSIPLELRVAEAWALRQAGLVAGVTRRQVPDGDAFVDDVTGGTQTVTLATPATASVEDGDYALSSWSLQYRTGARRPWLASLTLEPDPQ